LRSKKTLHANAHSEEIERFLKRNIALIPLSAGVKVRSPRLQSDHEKGKDLLDVNEQARALGDTIAFKDLTPPFVGGIRGGWGSGKSFTFNLIKERLAKIQELDLSGGFPRSESPFVGHIYLVKFDAWTYTKSNLWASLMYQV